MGALRVAAGVQLLEFPADATTRQLLRGAILALARRLHALHGDPADKYPFGDLVEWNDTPGRTAGEVAALLTDTARELARDPHPREDR